MTEGNPVPFEPGNVNENIITVWKGEGDPVVDILSLEVPLITGDGVPMTNDALLEGVKNFEVATEGGVEAEVTRLSVRE